MKNISLVFSILFSIAYSVSANNLTKSVPEQRIYLWDVTLSMKGYKDLTPNIYNDVIEFIKKDIRAIKDESTMIKVAPFQEGILEVWSEKATVEGKKRIIDKIESYDNKDVTDTDIMSALTKAECDMIDENLRNQLILLTDGKHNDKSVHAKFLEKINDGEWKKFATENNAFLRYVALIDIAVIPGFVNDETKMIQKGFENVVFADLIINQEPRFNIKDDRKVELYLRCSQDLKLPELRFRITCSDSIMKFDKDVVLKDGKVLAFPLNYDYNMLKKTIPEEYNLPINIELLDSEVDINQEILKPILHTHNLNLVLVNKPEKILTIKIKR